MPVFFIIEKYIKKMQLALEEIYCVELINRPPVIMKWRPGIEQRPHADKQLNNGEPNAFVNYDLNSLFYYNDDFEGGELFYPQHDIVVKPKPGLAIAHPGDVNYLHGVTMITSGNRYTTPSFYSVA
jgi:predicted 2-oxoglutarate/Fe(II)-dependent dioxygenase YbiX